MELSKDMLLEMYRTMLLSRRLDERAWILHRQGKIAFHISSIGHEAAQIGLAYAIRKGHDWIVPYYRDLTLMLGLGFEPDDFIMSLMGKAAETSSGGRQMPSHWSMKSANVVSHSSPVATQTPHAAGIGLGIKLRGEDKVVLTTIGEGSTSQGEWYEGVNWGAIHKLPVIYVVQNNIYAISVRQEKQMATETVAQKADGLGLPGIIVDGTNFIDVYKAAKEAVDRAREGNGPTLIETKTYRITPHSSDDDDRSYRSREEVEEHKKRDPITIARKYLEEQGFMSDAEHETLEAEIKEIVDKATKAGIDAPYPDPEEAAYPVYAEGVEPCL